jgi:hypothetical protein
MGKLLLLLSFMCLVFVGFGVVLFPQNSVFWLASGSSMYQHIRELLALVLVVQLVTRPPRHVWVRILAGAVAIGVGIWSIQATYSNQMLLLDSLSFLASSIAIGVTALERKPKMLEQLASDYKMLA